MNSKLQARPYSQFSEYKTEVPLARELPYLDFSDELTVLGDGSLVLAFQLRGLSVETWDADQINRMSTGLRALLNSLPDACEVSFISEVSSDFSETIEAHKSLRSDNPWVEWVAGGRIEVLNAEMRNGRLLRPSLYVFVYRRYEAQKSSGPTSLLKSFFSSPKRFQAIKKEGHDVAERELRQAAENLRERLESNGLSAAPLSGEDLWKMLFRFLNPKRAKISSEPKMTKGHRDQEFSASELARVNSLTLASPREQLVFSDLVQGYDSFFMDGYYHRVLTLKTLPEFTHAALASRLMQLPFSHMVHVHVQVPEQSKELANLQARRRMAHSMSVTQGGRASDLESEARLHSTEELLRELINTGQKIFYFQMSVLLQAESMDDLDTRTKIVLGTVREMNGAEAICETVAGFKVWKTLLPAGNIGTVRLKRVKTDNLADFLPLYEPYSGTREKDARPVCLFRNRNAGLVSYDPFDSRLPNYNTLVTGSSGAGKSFLNNLVLLQYVSQKPLIYIIDIGGSYRKLCEFLGGQYIEITPPRAGETCRAINPFQLPPGQSEPSPQKIKFLLALLENVLTDTDGDKLPKLDKSLLEESVLSIYKNCTDKTPRMSDLNAALANSRDEKLRQFSRMLYPWTGDRPYGRLLDAENGLDLQSDVVVFDLKGLSSYPDLQSVMILIITDFILGRIESRDGATQGRRKQILMDECWELLKSQASSHFMEYCVRTLRKTGSGITFITQGLEEIVASPIGSAILSNTATKFILLQRGDLEPIRKILKLNEQEMALISSLRQAKGKYSEAFLMANEARTVIRACPTPVEYWLATSDASDNALLADARAVFPGKDLAEIVHWLATQYPAGSQGVSSIPVEKKQLTMGA